MSKKAVDTPLSEIILRKYEKPYQLNKRELIRKVCLSVGLLQPGDSRDIIVDIFYVLLDAKKKRKLLSSEEIRKEVIAFRESEGLTAAGTAASNIRRQIRRLRELFLVEKLKNDYRITEYMNLETIFEERIEQFLLPSIIQRLKEYLMHIDTIFSLEKN